MGFHGGGWKSYVGSTEEKPKVTRSLLKRVLTYARPYAGQIAGMLALGFSINLITLFGLVLAIGIVVDDAIVVVENVERNMHEHHLAPKEATIRSMDEIASSLVAVVLVMSSVFVPAAFLPGTTGQLYKQFAVTIVISVAVSGFVALTLTPAMSALMLKQNPPPHRGFFAWFTWVFVHILYLVGFQNRILVAVHWAFHYITFNRGARLITGAQDTARAGTSR